MAHTTTIADLRNAGVAIEPYEAIALVLELIQKPTCDPPEAPFGPPSIANLYLDADGSVSCRACETTPAVSEIAILLQQLLGDAPHRVAGGLRYAIARALLDVDAPPFDSLNDFAATLTRFERGDREQVLRALFARLAASDRTSDFPLQTSTPVTKFTTTLDRRQLMPSATDLRRELRKVDEQLYQSRRATDVVPAVIVQPRSSRRFSALAAGLAVGLLLSGSGELMHLRRHAARVERPPVATSETVVTPEAVRPPAALAAQRTDSDGAANVSPVAAPPSNGTADAPEVRRAAVSRASSDNRPEPRVSASRHRTGVIRQTTRARRAQDGGVLKRLRLQWLKSVFSSRS